MPETVRRGCNNNDYACNLFACVNTFEIISLRCFLTSEIPPHERILAALDNAAIVNQQRRSK